MFNNTITHHAAVLRHLKAWQNQNRLFLHLNCHLKGYSPVLGPCGLHSSNVRVARPLILVS